MLLLSHVIKALTGRVPDLANDFSIEEGCIDSREASKGSLFIALPGEKTDGHGYVDAAFANGAVLALIDHAIDSNYPVIDLQNLPDELPSHRLSHCLRTIACRPCSNLLPGGVTSLT